MTRLATGPARPSTLAGTATLRPSRARSGFGPLFASELVASVVGFGVTVRLARRLGPPGFADFEYAAAVAAWWLVVVRGGFDAIVAREAARRPRLVGPLTDALIGLRLGAAAVAMAAVLAIACASGGPRGRVVATFGLMLIPSALATDVGMRASGRFVGLAIAQVARALALLVGVAMLVSGPGDPAVAAACVVVAEVGSTLALLGFHAADHGLPRPRPRPRAWSALAGRGAIAGAHRFLRVSLYAADMIAIGSVAGASLGPYAGARRVAFAMLALGLVVPSAVGPRIARAWASGADEARSVVARAFGRLSTFVLPATVGLMATGDRWMPRLFGEGFREAGPWLALVAARVPFAIASNLDHSALIACRRERTALRQAVGMTAFALVAIPASALVSGPWGVGLAMLAVEVAGAFAGWSALRGLGIEPPWHHLAGPAIAGCVGVGLVCMAGRGWPLGGVVVGSAMAYAAVLVAFDRVGRAA